VTKTESSCGELTACAVVVLYSNDVLVAPSVVKQLCRTTEYFEGSTLLLWEDFVYTLKIRHAVVKGRIR
jgi:hypothetical protein